MKTISYGYFIALLLSFCFSFGPSLAQQQTASCSAKWEARVWKYALNWRPSILGASAPMGSRGYKRPTLTLFCRATLLDNYMPIWLLKIF